jgi:hypothetical protein
MWFPQTPYPSHPFFNICSIWRSGSWPSRNSRRKTYRLYWKSIEYLDCRTVNSDQGDQLWRVVDEVGVSADNRSSRSTFRIGSRHCMWRKRGLLLGDLAAADTRQQREEGAGVQGEEWGKESEDTANAPCRRLIDTCPHTRSSAPSRLQTRSRQDLT